VEAHQPHLCLDSAYFISFGGGCGRKAAIQGPGLFTVMATLLLIIAVQVSSPLTRVLVVVSAAGFLGMTTKLGPCCSHYSPAYEDTEQVEERLPWKLPTLLPLQ